MSLIFERDIPELKNKNWRQRRALYQQAGDRDKPLIKNAIQSSPTEVGDGNG